MRSSVRYSALGVFVLSLFVAGCGSVPSDATLDSSNIAPSAPPATTIPSTTVPVTLAPFEPIRFAIAGDVGTGDQPEWDTAAAMDVAEGDDEYQALLLLGDNVYPDGDPDLIEDKVLRPFAGVLDGPTELIAALGNHDIIDGNGPEHGERIGMPGEWYATEFDEVLIVTLDSNQAGNENQVRWLEETLASTEAGWKIAMMHHPAYSAGWHGSERRVQEQFVPLFEEYGVQLALAGHDHDYQRSEPINGTTYIVSGGAAKLRDTGTEDFTAFSRSVLHFVDMTVHPDRIELTALDQAGSVIDSVEIPFAP